MATLAEALSIETYRSFAPHILEENPVERRRSNLLTRPQSIRGEDKELQKRVRLLPTAVLERKISRQSGFSRSESFEDLLERFTPEEAMIISMIFIKGHGAEKVAQLFNEEPDTVRRVVIQAMSRVRKEVRR